MSFFNLSEGQLDTQKEFDMGGGDLEPIPNNTQVIAYIEDSKWDEHNGERFIKNKWTVIDGEYTNRVIFQKIKVEEADAKKKDKALRMLAAIDNNCGGKLQQLGVEPDDMQLNINLTNKPMTLLLKVWSIKDEETGEIKKGNWIGAVGPAGKAKEAPAQQQAPQTGGGLGF
ncbi:single strand DNA binding protein [Vibrio phage pYD21-A]|uniref:single strand DNA binding protein n=1 Tax=Vibrio phage pYD21-A TaxID=754049 RepID=UPI0002C084A2|nr:single strand DNA binding protein [Vibrio phage pYD21-A]AGH16092.1 hypothetical protein VPKG_00055 [Vibrio phage pYD21-A]